ncbi:MAG: elongation factor 1-beta [Desulfurococcus sp.]|nr:elongation factor 1-beta [Desulfurococcus sp.]
MGQLLVVARILPEGIEVSLEKLREDIAKTLPQGYELRMWEEEPVAFGLKALRLAIIMPEDVEGGTETLENLISQVEGVSSVEIEYVSRI